MSGACADLIRGASNETRVAHEDSGLDLFLRCGADGDSRVGIALVCVAAPTVGIIEDLATLSLMSD